MRSGETLNGRRNVSGATNRSDLGTTLGFVAAIVFFVASGVLSYWNIQVLERDNQLLMSSHEVLTALADVLSTMKDAETGQRGFVITGNDRYLDPYNTAKARLDEQLRTLTELSKNSASEETRLPEMKKHVDAKMSELAQTITLRRTRGFDAARAVVETDRGKGEMDALREEVDATQKDEQTIRDQRVAEMTEAYRTAIVTGIVSGLFGILLAVGIAILVRRAAAAQQRQEWLQTGQVGLAGAIFGEQRTDQLAENVLTYLAEYLDAHVGAFFVKDHGEFRRIASYGLPADGDTPERFVVGEGLLGQAAKDKQTFSVHDIPERYLSVGSGLMRANPRQLMITPTIADDEVNAVFELGFVHSVISLAPELLERASDAIGVAVRSAVDRTKLQELLEETQRQGEELQTQSEELRVSNEELEEQGRVLKESQARLEQQQLELEATNSQLEEQTQQLEVQRDDLNRSKIDLEEQAQDLERVSRFKSDFLANMSHELRTPLNSSLILAKLLADNREGNLSEEQIKYAQTIQSAGNDLLALISDILDLSKIEAGHMELNIESMPVASLVAALQRTFEPLASEKALEFGIEVEPGAPEAIGTDPQRLEQVLKNLLSNAIKFTEKGRVSLSIRQVEGSRIAFAVQDTGIGISEGQKEMVFEAFRQADGTTNRKYGGTGLGLSISRELARLLGGDISLASEPGRGSSFTVTIPTSLQTGAGQTTNTQTLEAPPRPAPTAPTSARKPDTSSLPTSQVDDDRDRLSGSKRLLLVVEDDGPFARILYDLAREQGFECLIATTAEEALALAIRTLPSGVLLDVGLPDNSGLSVLDRLKHDDRTRHIPVHIVSGGDYAQTAMAMGAVGYMLKPVKHEELVRTLQTLEQMLTKNVRRVLVVEDDAVQLESLRLLLTSQNVETVGARSAAECLSLLSSSTVDCMVLDLSLPDASGFSLLETLSQEERYSFPPVIVYTGRDLSSEEEQRLRKYSKSIIVKGAKSPERLLDEVALFLHQVVADLPPDQRRLIEKAKHRDADLEDRTILVVEDDIRNIFAITSILEPRGAKVEIARNGREALEVLERTPAGSKSPIDLVLMDIMMPEMDGLTAMREIRKNAGWKKLPIIALTAKAMKNDQEECLKAGANDYIAKPLDVDKLLSLIRVWMPRE